jgi:hypothetical protein
MYFMSGERFRELQDDFFVICARVQQAQKPEEELALLNELQRILRESTQALAETEQSLVDRNSRNVTTVSKC